MSDYRADVINQIGTFILLSGLLANPVDAKLLAQKIGENMSDADFREAQKEGMNPTELGVAVVLVFLGQSLRAASHIIVQAGLADPINPATFNN